MSFLGKILPHRIGRDLRPRVVFTTRRVATGICRYWSKTVLYLCFLAGLCTTLPDAK